MVQEIPLRHIQVALRNLMAVAVAVRVVEAEAGRALPPCAVRTCLGGELLGAGIRNTPETGVGLVERGRVEACKPWCMSNGVAVKERSVVGLGGRQGTYRWPWPNTCTSIV